jgi:flagellar biogenesis protein FliO
MNAVDLRPKRDGVPGWCLACLMALGLWLATDLGAQTVPSPVAPTAGTASLPSSIPVKREATDAREGDGAGAGLLGIAAVCVLVGVFAYVARKKMRATAPLSELARSSCMRLTPRHSLHVVEWEGRRLLVGCSEQTICLVAESPRAPTAEEAA